MSNFQTPLKTIVYFNVDYACQNNCIFCFSYHINNNINTFITFDNYKKALSSFNCIDRIIINGGEPLIHPNILEIIDYSSKKAFETVIYSNGNKLSNIQFEKEVFSRNFSRITIPIHGSEKVHNSVTRNSSSYEDVIRGLDNIKNDGYLKKVELKFIINEEMYKERFSIKDFLAPYAVDNIVICGQVSTKVSKDNKCDFKKDDSFYDYLSKEIKSLIGLYNIKIYDFELCKFSDVLIDIFSKCSDDANKFEYHFFDYIHLGNHLISYDKYKKDDECINCPLLHKCTSIIDNYNVLCIDKCGKCKLVFE